MIQVVCGIIFQKEKVFIARRKEGKSLAGYWEFPGGKIEKGELENHALLRELNEEFNMEVEIIHRIGAFTHSYKNFSINLIGFNCKLIQWNGLLTDHDKATWVYPEELAYYRLSDADLPFLGSIRNGEIK